MGSQVVRTSEGARLALKNGKIMMKDEEKRQASARLSSHNYYISQSSNFECIRMNNMNGRMNDGCSGGDDDYSFKQQ